MTECKSNVADTSSLQPTSRRGGARPGAGRKPGSGNGLVSKIQICVTPQQKSCYEKLGAARWLRTYLNDEVISSQLQSKNVLKSDPVLPNSEVKDEAKTLAQDEPRQSQLAVNVNFHNYLVANDTQTLVLASESDDMRVAGIFKGDLLIVDPKATPKDEDIIVIHRKEAYVPRRFHYVKSRRIELHTERSKGRDRVIELRKDSDFGLVGVVVGLVRKTR